MNLNAYNKKKVQKLPTHNIRTIKSKFIKSSSLKNIFYKSSSCEIIKSFNPDHHKKTSSSKNLSSELKKKVGMIIRDLSSGKAPKKNSTFSASFDVSQEMKEKFNKEAGPIITVRRKKEKEKNIQHFRKSVIRDFNLLRNDRDLSKQFYNIENDIQDFRGEAEKRFKLIRNFFEKKENFTEEACKKSLRRFYRMKLNKSVQQSNLIFEEIRNLNISKYEDMTKKQEGALINYNNLKRKIRVINIKKDTYDKENDDLGIKNLPLLKNKIKELSLGVTRVTSKAQLPKFMNKKLKEETIKKYRSHLGLFFGVG